MPSGVRIKYKTKDRFKKTWSNLVNGIGRQVVVYLPDTEHECPNCYYDKVNRSSSGVAKVSPGNPNYFIVGRCPICRGKGVLVTVRRRCIEAVVLWNPSGSGMNELTFTEAGYEGATKVEIKTDPCNLDLIRRCKYAVIDGIVCKLSNPPILRGMGDKLLMSVYFFTVEKPNPDSGEFI
jgi:hypothetical protein